MREKLCSFTGFHANVGETYAAFVLKMLPLFKAFVGKTFAFHQNSAETVKLFSHIAFVVNGISWIGEFCKFLNQFFCR